MRRTDDLTIKTLHAVVDWIVKDCCEDACMLCAYFNREEQQASLKNDDDDCCVWHRKQGDLACRNGIIEKFQGELTGGGNHEEK